MSSSLVRRPASRLLIFLVTTSIVLAACSGPDSNELDDPTAVAASTATAQSIPQSTATSDSEPTEPGATAQPDDTPAPADTAVVPQSTQTPSIVDNTATATGAVPSVTSTPSPPFDPNRVALGVEPVGSGFNTPSYVTNAGDGSGRLFVLEKIGTVRLLDGTMFLNITDRVVQTGVYGVEHEQGLLGLAFHPRFEENGYFYLHYNDLNGDHVISRFSIGADGLGDPGSEKVLLWFDQPEVNFQGGTIEFGPDGYLYIATGTGGEPVELQNNAQDLGSLLGKILRIDVDNGDPYGIPADNPFVGVEGARPEVWVIGLRNPWRFSFDPANGDFYAGGPGQFKREWINYQAAGQIAGTNFGWPMYEGLQCWEFWAGPCDPTGLTLPILDRTTYEGGGCVIIGGLVYRGPAYPLLHGAYLVSDFCSARIWTVYRDAAGTWTMTEMLKVDGALASSFGRDEAGEAYFVDILNGVIYRIHATER